MTTTAQQILIPFLKTLCDKYLSISCDPDSDIGSTPSSLAEAEDALQKACHIAFEKLELTPGPFSFIWQDENGSTAYTICFLDGFLVDVNTYPVIHQWSAV